MRISTRRASPFGHLALAVASNVAAISAAHAVADLVGRAARRQVPAANESRPLPLRLSSRPSMPCADLVAVVVCGERADAPCLSRLRRTMSRPRRSVSRRVRLCDLAAVPTSASVEPRRCGRVWPFACLERSRLYASRRLYVLRPFPRSSRRVRLCAAAFLDPSARLVHYVRRSAFPCRLRTHYLRTFRAVGKCGGGLEVRNGGGSNVCGRAA